jgi:hypothetical protein
MMDSFVGIIYAGDAGRGAALHAAVSKYGWYIYTPADAMEALGMYIFYSPALVVIETGTDFAHEVYRHLVTVDARPLLILATAMHEAEWQIPATSEIGVLPLDAGQDEIIAAIGVLLEIQDSREPAIAG